MLRPPILSEYDPSAEGEGSVDPLGLQPGYERLADQILPAVTVRMGRPRYLTAIAVGAHLCSEWDDESFAADGVTPPWLVFEWFVVESFVRSRDKLVDTNGIPGIQKVENAIQKSRHVSQPAYLKTPSVFGYTGIFRRLARRARVIGDSGDVDEAGFQLLKAWSVDQGLTGFLDGAGPGRDFKEALRKAVREGMERGQTAYRPLEWWHALAARLEPGRPGKAERKLLVQLIEERCGDTDSVAALVKELKVRGHALDYPDEAPFLRAMRPRAPEALREQLSAIDAYEAFCRPLTDSFILMRHLSTAAGGGSIGPDEFAKHPRASKLKKALNNGVKAAADSETLAKVLPALAQVLQRFEGVGSAQQLFSTVLEHHEAVQGEKPPDGKRAWVERSRGKIIVRAAYGVDEASDPTSPYVHNYRVPTFSRFLNDLRALS